MRRLVQVRWWFLRLSVSRCRQGGRPPPAGARCSPCRRRVRSPCNRRSVRRAADPGRGMLLLSGAKFVGGHRVGRASGGAFRVALPRTGAWELARAGSAAWAGPNVGRSLSGEHRRRRRVRRVRPRAVLQRGRPGHLRPVARQRGLPQAAECGTREVPRPRLSNRTVRLRLQLPGYEPALVQETEGATIAFRVPGTPRGPVAASLRARRGDPTQSTCRSRTSSTCRVPRSVRSDSSSPRSPNRRRSPTLR